MGKGTLIGEGLTAEVYEWDGGRAVKLFRDWCSRDHVRREAEVGRAVYAAGFAAPATGSTPDEPVSRPRARSTGTGHG